jgi:DNA-binding protein HU-beta
MNKGELVDVLASEAGVTKVVAGRMLDVLTSTIIDTLKAGDEVVLPKFGSFSVGERAARTGRNPQTGEPIQIKASKIPKFKPGKAMKDAVQES